MVLSAHRLTLRLILPCFPPDENKDTVEAPALRRAVGADQLADPDGLLLPVHWLPPQLGHTFVPRMWKGMPSGVPFSDQGFVNPLRPTEWQWPGLQFGNEKVPNGAFSVPMKDLLTRFELSFQSRELLKIFLFFA